jgi:hypothetical protein
VKLRYGGENLSVVLLAPHLKQLGIEEKPYVLYQVALRLIESLELLERLPLLGIRKLADLVEDFAHCLSKVGRLCEPYASHPQRMTAPPPSRRVFPGESDLLELAENWMAGSHGGRSQVQINPISNLLGGGATGKYPEVVGEVRRDPDEAIADTDSTRRVWSHRDELHATRRNEPAALQILQDLMVQLNVFKQTYERSHITRLQVRQGHELSPRDRRFHAGDRVAMRAEGFASQLIQQRVLHFVSNHLLPVLSLLVARVPRDSQQVHQHPLGEAMPTHDDLGDIATSSGE